MATMAVDRRELSFWHATLPAAASPRPALARDIDCDVAVLGIGCTVLRIQANGKLRRRLRAQPLQIHRYQFPLALRRQSGGV